MRSPLALIRFVTKAALNLLGGGVAGDFAVEVVPDVARDVWKWWSKDRSEDQLRAEVQEIAHLTDAEVRQQAEQVVAEEGASEPEKVRTAVTAYLVQMPNAVRQSQRRPTDPTGRTVASSARLQGPDDLVSILPARMPRFRPGDRPLPGVDWELEELLGVGGFGEVWKARNPHFSSVAPVALKFCLDSSAARLLRHEAAILNRVMDQGRHPGIVALKQTYLSADPPCLEYEYVEGGELTALIREYRSRGGMGPLNSALVLKFLAGIVGFAHRLDPPIVHRDLKPANILVRRRPDGKFSFRVADFGIGGLAARQAIGQSLQGLTHGQLLASSLRGAYTPLYASPQQMRGEPPDPRDDVYSLGVLWYQLLTADTATGRPGGRLWRSRLVESGSPLPLVSLLEDCFEDDPSDRPSDAIDLAERIAVLLTPPPSVIPAGESNFSSGVSEKTSQAVQPSIKAQGVGPANGQEVEQSRSSLEPGMETPLEAATEKGPACLALPQLTESEKVRAAKPADPSPQTGRKRGPKQLRDRFGCVIGKAGAKINAVLADKPKTPEQIAQETGLAIKSVLRHLRDWQRQGRGVGAYLIERESGWELNELRQPMGNLLITGKVTVNVRIPGVWYCRPISDPSAEWGEKGETPGHLTLSKDEAYALSPTALATDDDLDHICKMLEGVESHIWLSECEQITDTGIEKLTKLYQLHSIDIHTMPQITDEGIRKLAAITTLQKITLQFVHFTDITLSFVIRNLKNLRSLFLQGCHRITGNFFAEVNPPPPINDLWITDCPEVDDTVLLHIGNLTLLQVLDLSRLPKITDSGIKRLDKLSSLHTLSLSEDSQLTGVGLSHLGSLGKLESLDFHNCEQFSDEAITFLANYPSLLLLDLNLCKRITDQGLANMSKCHSLTELYLQGLEQCTNRGVNYLSMLTRLERLSLENWCHLTDDGLKLLRQLSRLRWLNLKGCHRITRNGIETLRASLPNCDVWLD